LSKESELLIVFRQKEHNIGQDYSQDVYNTQTTRCTVILQTTRCIKNLVCWVRQSLATCNLGDKLAKKDRLKYLADFCSPTIIHHQYQRACLRCETGHRSVLFLPRYCTASSNCIFIMQPPMSLPLQMVASSI